MIESGKNKTTVGNLFETCVVTFAIYFTIYTEKDVSTRIYFLLETKIFQKFWVIFPENIFGIHTFL